MTLTVAEGASKRSSSSHMSLPASSPRLSAKTSYKKLPGLLVLTDTHLLWTQDGKKKSAVEVPHAEAVCQYRTMQFLDIACGVDAYSRI